MLLDLPSDINPVDLFNRLGGSVKLVRVEGRLEAGSELAQQVVDALIAWGPSTGRLMFGLSHYGSPKPANLSRLPQAVKSLLAQRGRDSRYIAPPPKSPPALTSAQVEKTGLLEKGADAVLLRSETSTWIGKTVQVQQFEDFARRDFGKPERRIDPGLLPPKLARMMLNLAGLAGKGAILDPFCGSGVVLAEGALLGYRMTGLDCSPEAVEASRVNLEWLEGQYPGLPPWRLETGDARQTVRRLGPLAFDAVVGEGDLGPIFSRSPTEKETRGLVKRYKSFYTTVLAELRSAVRPGGGVVLAVPRWVLGEGRSVGLSLDGALRLMGYRRPCLFDACVGKMPRDWQSRPLVYRRQGQRTAREILCLKA